MNNGNILFLQRNGKTGIDGVGVTTYGEMDKLKYEYRGNQLLKVTDSAIDTEGFIDGSNTDNDYDYDYDKNGNMIIDKNKSIDDATTATDKSVISYNYLNLPEKVVKSNGEYLKYIYDATGRKLSQEVYNASNQLQKKSDYAGEFFYEDNTLKFVNHEEGRVVMSRSQGEYQYHLKDHLGNVRLTFTTKEEVESVTATLEDAKATTEQSQFLNYAEVRKIDNKVFDHTDEGGTYNSTRLMGGNTTEIYGLAKTLSVMPGDVIRMEVYAKYLDPETDNWSAALQNVISSIAGSGNAGGTYVDGGQLGTTNGQFPYQDLLVRENDEGVGPKAYLNYLVFDRDFKYLTGGFKRVSTAAGESGTTLGINNAEGVNHEHLHFDDGIVINEAGFVYVYLSNENETPVEVFFDDFKVEHVKSPVVQMDDYYPFGLTFNSYSRENTTYQDHKYNGKELQDELGLGWLDYGARMYMNDIGRWGVIDPLAGKYLSLSPYNYVGNIPTVLIDPDGRKIEWGDNVTKNEKRTIKRALREHKSSSTYKSLYKEIKKSDNRYVIKTENNESSTYGGTFDANYTKKHQIESELGGTSTFELQNAATMEDFKSDEKGGVITINTAWIDMESANDVASILVEEIVHAAQYENSVGGDGVKNNGFPASANNEFEAKAIIGQIDHESKRELWTNAADKSANAYGVNAFRTKSVQGYFPAMQQWHKGAYESHPETNAQPTLLIRLVK